MRQIYCLIVLAVGILFFSACGQNIEPTEDTVQQGNEIIEIDEPEVEEPETIEPLSILAPIQYRYIIRRTAARNGILIDLTTYSQERRDEQLDRLRVMLMAGQSYDMFFLDGHPLFEFSQLGLLMDFYELIDADPNVSREDFFTQALSAWEIDGGLYAFPMDFGFSYAFINADLPQPIIERFAQHSAITITELMEIYLEFMTDYSYEFGHLIFSGGTAMTGISPRWTLHSKIGNFVDFENLSADFTDGNFVEFLNVFIPIFGEGRRGHFNPVNASLSRMRGMVDEYVFLIASFGSDPGFAFIDAQPYFLHGIPMVDDRGHLIISGPSFGDLGTWGEICIVRTGNEQRSWEFTQMLIPAFSQYCDIEADGTGIGWGVHSISSPIKRELFSSHMDEAFKRLIDPLSRATGNLLPQDSIELSQTVDNAISSLAAISEMPMTLGNLSIPEDLYIDHMDLLLRSLISPEEFAQRLQNSFSLWLLGG